MTHPPPTPTVGRSHEPASAEAGLGRSEPGRRHRPSSAVGRPVRRARPRASRDRGARRPLRPGREGAQRAPRPAVRGRRATGRSVRARRRRAGPGRRPGAGSAHAGRRPPAATHSHGRALGRAAARERSARARRIPSADIPFTVWTRLSKPRRPAQGPVSPYADRSATTSCGLTCASRSGVQPSRASAPGLNPQTSTSAAATSDSTRLSRRSSRAQRLPADVSATSAGTSSKPGASRRSTSPAATAARTFVAVGPAITRVRSSTRSLSPAGACGRERAGCSGVGPVVTSTRGRRAIGRSLWVRPPLRPGAQRCRGGTRSKDRLLDVHGGAPRDGRADGGTVGVRRKAERSQGRRADVRGNWCAGGPSRRRLDSRRRGDPKRPAPLRRPTGGARRGRPRPRPRRRALPFAHRAIARLRAARIPPRRRRRPRPGRRPAERPLRRVRAAAPPHRSGLARPPRAPARRSRRQSPCQSTGYRAAGERRPHPRPLPRARVRRVARRRDRGLRGAEHPATARPRYARRASHLHDTPHGSLAAPHLREGLTPTGARRAVRHLRALLDARAVALVACDTLLAWDGGGASAHAADAPRHAGEALRTGRTTVLDTGDVACADETCPSVAPSPCP